MGIGRPSREALRQILFGQYRGLLYATPWLAAAVPGTIVLARRHLAETLVCLCGVLLFLWLNASIPPWDGGWAAGPRYLVPALPFLSILAGGILLAPRAGRELRVALAVFGLFSAANMLAVTAVKPEMPTSFRRPYAELVWPSFIAGDLAISTQSIDAIDNPPNAPRQAWNLGMKAGLEGQASLVPLYIWIAAMLGWLGLLSRRGARAA
jgi:hypothetical protein